MTKQAPKRLIADLALRYMWAERVPDSDKASRLAVIYQPSIEIKHGRDMVFQGWADLAARMALTEDGMPLVKKFTVRKAHFSPASIDLCALLGFRVVPPEFCSKLFAAAFDPWEIVMWLRRGITRGTARTLRTYDFYTYGGPDYFEREGAHLQPVDMAEIFTPYPGKPEFIKWGKKCDF